MKIYVKIAPKGLIPIVCIALLFCFTGLISDDLYISLIVTKYSGGTITINFEPLVSENARYRIYRSKTPIIAETDLDRAKLIAEITAQALPLEDNPGADGKYYYAVTVMEESIELIPYLNTMAKPVDFSPIPDPITQLDIKLVSQREEKNPEIELLFQPVEADISYYLYQSNSKFEKIEGNLPIAKISGGKDRFRLAVERAAPYYFAVTTVNRLGVENKSLRYEENANSKPFIIREEEKPEKVVFKPPSSRELIERNLRQNFYKGRYNKTLETFQSILKTQNLSSGEQGMVYFFMGQSYFYLKNYQKAVKYFVISKEEPAYRTMSQVWIDRSLQHIR
jgi:hypothetical protein